MSTGGATGATGATWASDRADTVGAARTAGGAGSAAGASDIELLGRIYGTTPPEAFYRHIEREPEAYQFRSAWKARTERAAMQRRNAGARGDGPMLSTSVNPLSGGGAAQGAPGGAAQGAPGGAVSGTVAFPVVLGDFSDSPASPPFSASEVRREFFEGPNSRFITIPQLYDEMSGGRVQLEGGVTPWVRSTLTQEEVAGGSSGLGGSSRVGDFIVGLLEQLDGQGFDWSGFDNDGPDGIPNSGDDDGFVDVLAVIHPTRGAECGDGRNSDRVWSHRWNLQSAVGGSFSTSTPRPGGGAIRVNDFTIQPVLSCDNSSINEIGVFAHELGHGFGLPDLYSTSSTASHAGAGSWDLMASGSWGCRGGQPQSPCHMGAWSKAALGWLDVELLDADTDHGVLTLPPVLESSRAFEIRSGDGSGEYFLLENRQRLGSDANLHAPGVLIWHIDPAVVNARWSSNTINNDAGQMGVWLRQADGADHLSSSTGGRGDAGDPFPGGSGSSAFHAASSPASRSHLGNPTGLTILDIGPAGAGSAGGSMEFRLLTRFPEMTLRARNPDEGTASFTVDGADPGAEAGFRSAPFQEHTITAALSLGEGVRGTVTWEDGASAVRTFTTQLADSVLLAGHDGTEFLVDVALVGAPDEVVPATLSGTNRSDEGWVADGAEMTLEAIPFTGFSFREWTGALSGQPNPATLVVTGPLSAGAAFDVTFGVGGASALAIEAALPQVIGFEVRNANLPVAWSLVGELPDGLAFDEGAGEVRGAALEHGTFAFTAQVRDALGLEADIAVTLSVTPPIIGIEALVHLDGPPGAGGPAPPGSPWAPGGVPGDPPTPEQRAYLDANGNGNGRYDVGDMRAFVIANPHLPMSTGDRGVARARITLPELRREGGR